jgi:hypothetical protein
MKVKLAEALLRRKELAEKVSQTKTISTSAVYDVQMKRQSVSEGIDDIVARVPKLTLAQVTAEHDHFSRGLRLVDAAIQQANWQTEVEVDPRVMVSYAEWQAEQGARAMALAAATADVKKD